MLWSRRHLLLSRWRDRLYSNHSSYVFIFIILHKFLTFILLDIVRCNGIRLDSPHRSTRHKCRHRTLDKHATHFPSINLHNVSPFKCRPPRRTSRSTIRCMSFSQPESSLTNFTTQYLKDGLNKFTDYFGEDPRIVSRIFLRGYIQAAQNWLDAGEGRRVCRVIMGVTTSIWFLWQIPRLRPFMTRHFMHDSLSGLSHTLLTNVLRWVGGDANALCEVDWLDWDSHRGFIHLLFNNMALGGFGKHHNTFPSK